MLNGNRKPNTQVREIQLLHYALSHEKKLFWILRKNSRNKFKQEKFSFAFQKHSLASSRLTIILKMFALTLKFVLQAPQESTTRIYNWLIFEEDGNVDFQIVPCPAHWFLSLKSMTSIAASKMLKRTHAMLLHVWFKVWKIIFQLSGFIFRLVKPAQRSKP